MNEYNFVREKSQFLMGKSPFFIGKSPFLIGTSLHFPCCQTSNWFPELGSWRLCAPVCFGAASHSKRPLRAQQFTPTWRRSARMGWAGTRSLADWGSACCLPIEMELLPRRNVDFTRSFAKEPRFFLVVVPSGQLT